MKILELFGLSKEQRATAENERKAKALRRQQEALIDDLESEKDKLIGQKVELLDLSSKTDIEGWAKKYQEVLVKIDIVDAKIKVAQQTNEELFSDEPKAKA